MPESEMQEFDIKIDTLPDNWSEIVESLRKEGFDAEPLLTPRDEDNAFPIPWDAEVTIEGEFIVLTGFALPGGPGTNGEAVTKFPRKYANQFFMLTYQVYEKSDGPASIHRFADIMDKYGVVYSI